MPRIRCDVYSEQLSLAEVHVREPCSHACKLEVAVRSAAVAVLVDVDTCMVSVLLELARCLSWAIHWFVVSSDESLGPESEVPRCSDSEPTRKPWPPRDRNTKPTSDGRSLMHAKCFHTAPTGVQCHSMRGSKEDVFTPFRMRVGFDPGT